MVYWQRRAGLSRNASTLRKVRSGTSPVNAWKRLRPTYHTCVAVAAKEKTVHHQSSSAALFCRAALCVSRAVHGNDLTLQLRGRIFSARLGEVEKTWVPVCARFTW